MSEIDRSQSEQIDQLVAAIVAAQLKMTPAVKDHVNPYFKSKYADLPSVWEAAEPFRNEGVAITQSPVEAPDGFIMLDTQLSHKSGQWMRSRLKMRVAKDDPQGYGSALTYARRYALGCMTGIVTEEDDDGNAASQPQKPHFTGQNKVTALAKIAELRAEGTIVKASTGQEMQEPARQDGGERDVNPSHDHSVTRQGPDAAAPFISDWKVPNATWMKPDCGKRADELDDATLTKYVNYYEGKLAKEPNSRYRGEWDEALRALVAVAMHREQSNPALL